MNIKTTRAEIQIADIISDPLFQVRAKLDPKTVTRYVDVKKTGGELPPVRIMLVNGAPMLVDGWHRLEAARKLGEPLITAEITIGTEADLQWAAAEANLAHGLPLKKAELRNVFRAYVAAGKHLARGRKPKAAREIGRDIGGINHITVLSWMRSDFPHVHKAMTSGQLEEDRRAPNEKTSLEDRREAAIFEALAVAAANSRGVTNPRRRGEIVARIGAMLEQVKAARSYEIPERDPEFF